MHSIRRTTFSLRLLLVFVLHIRIPYQLGSIWPKIGSGCPNSNRAPKPVSGRSDPEGFGSPQRVVHCNSFIEWNRPKLERTSRQDLNGLQKTICSHQDSPLSVHKTLGNLSLESKLLFFLNYRQNWTIRAKSNFQYDIWCDRIALVCFIIFRPAAIQLICWY